MVAKTLSPARTALIVEDDPSLRKLVTQLLKVMNFTVSEVPDGAKAMVALKETTVDLVVLDLNLPESSGFDVLEFIRKEVATKPPILMMSARGLPEDRALAIELGAALYLKKPFTHSEFTQSVRTVLEGKT